MKGDWVRDTGVKGEGEGLKGEEEGRKGRGGRGYGG